MPLEYNHGTRVIELSDGVRTITTLKSSVIGLVGTAPDADPAKFPLNTPVLILGSLLEAADLDTVGNGLGTLPAALDDIFDQAGAAVVVVRVEEDVDPAVTKSNVIGGTDSYEGLHALLGAENAVAAEPRLIIATGFSDDAAVAAAMIAITERLNAFCYIDGPNTTDADAIAYRDSFGTDSGYVIDPWFKVWDTVSSSVVIRPPSARFAGIRAAADQENGFWTSTSNRVINGVVGVSRDISFKLGDVNSRANLLNKNEVTTVIQKDGYRTWGSRTCSTDPKWAFEHVRRTAHMIQDSIQVAHMWAVDQNISSAYIDNVLEGIRAYLRLLKKLGAIIDGSVWVDKELNTAATMAAGQLYFDFDFSAPAIAENISFRSLHTTKYLTQVLEGA